MIGRSRTAYQTSYKLLCQMLRGALLDGVDSGGVGSVTYRATAALYALLLAHPIDRRGRCRSCRHPGPVLGLRRCKCRVHGEAHLYLHSSGDAILLSCLTSELGLTVPRPPIAGQNPDWPSLTISRRADQDDTEVLPRIEAGPRDLSAQFSQAPTVSPPPPSPSDGAPRTADWSESDHGGAGVHPDGPLPRRGPPDEQPSGDGMVLVAEGALCLT